MNRQQLALKAIEGFRKRAGGITAAALLIQAELKCSFSKAEKIAAGRYTCRISAAEQEKLSGLMTRPKKAKSKGSGSDRAHEQVA